MPAPTFNQLITLDQGGTGYNAETIDERILTCLSVLASGQNPDGTAGSASVTGVFITPEMFGAKGDGVQLQDAVVAGTNTLTSPSGPFKPTDVGKTVVLPTPISSITAINGGSSVSGIAYAVTAISTANPSVVTTSPAIPGLANGQSVTIANASGAAAANGTWVVGNVTGATFSLTGVNGAAFTYAGSGATATVAITSVTVANLQAAVTLNDTLVMTQVVYGGRNRTVLLTAGASYAGGGSSQTMTVAGTPVGQFTTNNCNLVDQSWSGLTTTISSYTSATVVNMANNAPYTQTNVLATYGTLNATPLNNALTAAITAGVPLRLKAGIYMIEAQVATPYQSTGWAAIIGAGKYATTLYATQSMVGCISMHMPGTVEDLTCDQNYVAQEGISYQTNYINNQSVGVGSTGGYMTAGSNTVTFASAVSGPQPAVGNVVTIGGGETVIGAGPPRFRYANNTGSTGNPGALNSVITAVTGNPATSMTLADNAVSSVGGAFTVTSTLTASTSSGSTLTIAASPPFPQLANVNQTSIIVSDGSGHTQIFQVQGTVAQGATSVTITPVTMAANWATGSNFAGATGTRVVWGTSTNIISEWACRRTCVQNSWPNGGNAIQFLDGTVGYPIQINDVYVEDVTIRNVQANNNESISIIAHNAVARNLRFENILGKQLNVYACDFFDGSGISVDLGSTSTDTLTFDAEVGVLGNYTVRGVSVNDPYGVGTLIYVNAPEFRAEDWILPGPATGGGTGTDIKLNGYANQQNATFVNVREPAGVSIPNFPMGKFVAQGCYFGQQTGTGGGGSCFYVHNASSTSGWFEFTNCDFDPTPGGSGGSIFYTVSTTTMQVHILGGTTGTSTLSSIVSSGAANLQGYIRGLQGYSPVAPTNPTLPNSGVATAAVPYDAFYIIQTSTATTAFSIVVNGSATITLPVSATVVNTYTIPVPAGTTLTPTFTGTKPTAYVVPV